MLGPDAVVTGALVGGRDPADRIRLVPWGDERPEPDRAPWPGRLPAPAPASVPPEPLPVDVVDASGTPVGVTARLAITGAPAGLVLTAPGRGAAEVVRVTGWAGPWPVDELWWAPGEERRRVRFQMCLADGRALLLALESGTWSVSGVYD
jgi:protein ImuB